MTTIILTGIMLLAILIEVNVYIYFKNAIKANNKHCRKEVL
jgi:hypothetical protein